MDTDSCIQGWLRRHELGSLYSMFAAHDIDMDVLADLTDSDLTDIGLSLGMRLRVRRALNNWLGSADKPNSEQPGPTSQGTTPAGERRLVSVCFCDIVDSSRWVSRMDPEQVRTLLNEYRALVTRVASRYDAHVAQFLGDGALLYLSYPNSHENDAECAIRTALELIQETKELRRNDPNTPQLRIGIASGRVVIDTLVGDQETNNISAVGRIPHLAARLQQLAAVGSIYIDRKTRQLAGDHFGFNFLGDSMIKGFGSVVGVYEVTGNRQVESRFVAQHRTKFTEIVGRDHELASLSDRWKMVLQGTGQMVLLLGEPGIGKSRMVWEVINNLHQQGTATDLYQCSPLHSHSAFYPFVDHLEQQAANSIDGDFTSFLFDAFEIQGEVDPEEMQALASLFGREVKTASTVVALVETPEQKRERVINALHRRFVESARRAPMTIVIEDLHWCDPTTLETINALLNKLVDVPLMIIATARSEFSYPFAGRVNVSHMVLNRLSRFNVDSILGHLLEEQELPSELYDLVSERTDGVPLFIEELTHNLLESGHIEATEQGVRFNQQRGVDNVPDTLHAILMSRLDNLGSLKHIAQLAACIGRAFSFHTLSQVVRLTENDLRSALEQLQRSGLVYSMGASPSARYSFKHALVRDVAYDSLLTNERRQYHQRIAEALIKDRENQIAVPPELLALHLGTAGEPVAAVTEWKNAAIVAKQRSANTEAVAHINEALKLLPMLDVAADKASLELDLLLELVAPLRSIKGFAAGEVTKATERALKLSDRAGDVRGILPLLYTQWVHHFVTGHRDNCLVLANGILDRGLRENDDLLCMTGRRAVGASRFTAGHFTDAVRQFDLSIEHYRQSPQAGTTQLVGLDSQVVAMGYQSLALWCLGRLDQSHQKIDAALQNANRLAHASTLAFAVYHHTLLYGLLERDAQRLLEGGARLRQIGDENRFEMWHVCGRLLVSLGDAQCKLTDQALAAAEAVLVEFEDMGVVYRPAYSTFLAWLCLRTDRINRGIRHAEVASELLTQSGERWYESVTLGTIACLRHAADTQSESASFEWARARRLASDQDADQLIAELENMQSGRMMEVS